MTILRAADLSHDLAVDDLIVGAGPAGCVIASRLSRDPTRRIALLEAGGEGAHADTPPGVPILDHDVWRWSAAPTPGSPREVPYPVARGLGGTAAINGSVHLLPFPADLDAWQGPSDQAWTWEAVAPYLVGGPDADAGSVDWSLPQTPPTALSAGFATACERLGMPWLDDLNAAPRAGVGRVPLGADPTGRRTPVRTLLGPRLEQQNLLVVVDARVDRLVLQDGRARGVEVRAGGHAGRPVCVRADRIILTAGAIGTPALLLRSGIGNPTRLERRGISCTHPLDGVGQGLQDHPSVTMWGVSAPGASANGMPWHEVMARIDLSGGSEPDAALTLLANAPAATLPPVAALMGPHDLAFGLAAGLLRPRSRGQVDVTGPDPDAAPVIDLRLAESDEDAHDLATAVRTAWSLAEDLLQESLAAQVLVWTRRLVEADTLPDTVRRFVAPTWHAAATAAMGRRDDDGSVVDAHGRPWGTENLWVADPSIFPAVPSVPPTPLIVAVAERCAEWLS